MEHLLELIQQRQSPGILIFNYQGRLCYSNKEALMLLPNLSQTESKGKPRHHIPVEIKNICSLAKGTPVEHKDFSSLNVGTHCAIMIDENERVFSLRASLVDSLRQNGKYGYIIVFIERVIKRHLCDIDKFKSRYHLTVREVEIIKSVTYGLCNKNIAEKHFISENTVKVHLKHIMRKIGTTSRNGIIAALLEDQLG